MQIIDFLKTNNKTIAIVESCTGGLLNYQFSKVIGASSVYLGGIISYQDIIKNKVLGIDENIIKKYTPYSFVVLDLMLEGIINLMDCDFSIATSGIAGPSGYSDENPIGSVYIGIKQKNHPSIKIKKIFNGNREDIQLQASLFAIDFFTNNFINKTKTNSAL
ncbi:CinA family protein [Helicobacter sp. MIT 14-3879]|uniref:CinA family protein n=1 Tax=Helicobacter sp. MIT 14-3879 TaxID=2040649 RepID=UPI000E1F011F|nr:CinA family protein [Helicobacter sp. MIT 14-3879]RDU61648.1 hypothetical protein CQA44_08385 [Helicobacter sp. MIT 14-3879]